jgi:hypothetical protein
MATGLAARDWQRLYRRLTANIPTAWKNRPRSYPGAEPLKAALTEFEKAAGFKLPRSYKTFVKVFGPGELGGYFRICIPGDQECGDDLATQHELVSATFRTADDLEHGDLLNRLLFFASTIGGETVGWDPLDVTDPRGCEYRVYYVTRSNTCKAIAPSFPEFVSEICLKNNLYKYFGWKNQEPEDWPPQTFLPYPAKSRR